MPSLGMHLALTLFFIAACLKAEDRKFALALIPLGIICDLDSYIGVHRATFHNLFVIFIPLIVMFILWRLNVNAIKDKYFILASLLLTFHIFLDTFYNGVFLFYPFSDKSYDIEFWLGLKETGLSALFQWTVPGKVGEINYVVTPTPSVPEIAIISGIEFVVLLFASITFFLKFQDTYSSSFLYQKLRIRK